MDVNLEKKYKAQVDLLNLKTKMMINVNFELKSSDNVYTVSGDDNTEKPIIRYRAITNGLIKYGGFERIDNFSFKLKCNQRNEL